VYINIEVAVKFLYVLILLNVAFAVAVYAMKIKKLRRTRTELGFEVKIKDYLLYLQVNIRRKEPLNAPPFSLNKVEQEAMQERLNDMIENFTGAATPKMHGAMRTLGSGAASS